MPLLQFFYYPVIRLFFFSSLNSAEVVKRTWAKLASVLKSLSVWSRLHLSDASPILTRVLFCLWHGAFWRMTRLYGLSRKYVWSTSSGCCHGHSILCLSGSGNASAIGNTTWLSTCLMGLYCHVCQDYCWKSVVGLVLVWYLCAHALGYKHSHKCAFIVVSDIKHVSLASPIVFLRLSIMFPSLAWSPCVFVPLTEDAETDAWPFLCRIHFCWRWHLDELSVNFNTL